MTFSHAHIALTAAISGGLTAAPAAWRLRQHRPRPYGQQLVDLAVLPGSSHRLEPRLARRELDTARCFSQCLTTGHLGYSMQRRASRLQHRIGYPVSESQQAGSG